MTRVSKKPHVLVTGMDGLAVLAIAMASVTYESASGIPPGGVAQFLAMRVTILNAAFASLFVLTWIYCFTVLDLYRFTSGNTTQKLISISKGCIAMTALLDFYLMGMHATRPASRIAAVFFITSFLFESLRIFGGAILRQRIAARDPRRVLILGSGRRAGKAWRELRTRYHSTIKVVGFADDRPVSEMAPDIADRYVGTIDELNELILRNVVDEILVAMPVKSCYDLIQRAIGIAEQVGVQVVYLHDVYATTRKQNVFDDPHLFSELVTLPEHYVTKKAVKRLLDICGAVLGLCLLSPVFLMIAIAIKATTEGPVFFVQLRYGHRRRLFRMYKFRSMVSNAPELMAQLEEKNEAEGPIFKIRDDPRITRLGKLLRATSLDELPQIWNVLRGDMSLVGPRPMSVRDVSLFSQATLMRRFCVKPGITGLWQVSGRSSVSFDQWMKFDFNYIDDWSLGLDLRILARTVTAVLRRTGAV